MKRYQTLGAVHFLILLLWVCVSSSAWAQSSGSITGTVRDNTDAVVAHDLERAGVPKTDIVLGFQPPDVRPLTEYAVA